jgi:hypothetical protein
LVRRSNKDHTDVSTTKFTISPFLFIFPPVSEFYFPFKVKDSPLLPALNEFSQRVVNGFALSAQKTYLHRFLQKTVIKGQICRHASSLCKVYTKYIPPDNGSIDRTIARDDTKM